MEVHLGTLTFDIPEADQDGCKIVPIPDDIRAKFWHLWEHEKALCRWHGFGVTFDGEWMIEYHPYAIYAEGQKRLEREKETQC